MEQSFDIFKILLKMIKDSELKHKSRKRQYLTNILMLRHGIGTVPVCEQFRSLKMM